MIKVLRFAASSALPYFMAVRPKTLTASFVPVAMGTALAPVDAINFKLATSVFMTALFIQIGTNLTNDAMDFVKGADTPERLGQQRLIQKGLMGTQAVFMAGLASFALASLSAIPFLALGGLPFVGILLLSIFLGWAYTGGPYPLAYKGLGDIFVILFFGLVLTSASYYLQVGQVSLECLVAGLQIGLLATVLIAINNLRDIKQDEKADKRTLAVRFGKAFAKKEIAIAALVPFVLNFYWLSNSLILAFLPFFSLPLAINLVRNIFKHEPGTIYNRFLQEAALLHMSFGVLFLLARQIG